MYQLFLAKKYIKKMTLLIPHFILISLQTIHFISLRDIKHKNHNLIHLKLNIFKNKYTSIPLVIKFL